MKNELPNVVAAIEPQPLAQYVFAEKYAIAGEKTHLAATPGRTGLRCLLEAVREGGKVRCRVPGGNRQSRESIPRLLPPLRQSDPPIHVGGA